VLRFADDDGLKLELLISDLGNTPLVARHPDVPEEYAIQGLHGARAYAVFHNVEDSILTELLGFTYESDGEYVLDGSDRRFRFAYDAPTYNDDQGAGSVHHIAWASTDEDHLAWQERIARAGGFVTDVRDRDYFKSIYFRVPSGVLFEIATLSPGFALDEDPEHLGEALRLPSQHEHLRAQLEQTLRPVNNPRVLA
jgi:glyoxalase family protein